MPQDPHDKPASMLLARISDAQATQIRLADAIVEQTFA